MSIQPPPPALMSGALPPQWASAVQMETTAPSNCVCPTPSKKPWMTPCLHFHHSALNSITSIRQSCEEGILLHLSALPQHHRLAQPHCLHGGSMPSSLLTHRKWGSVSFLLPIFTLPSQGCTLLHIPAVTRAAPGDLQPPSSFIVDTDLYLPRAYS